METVTAGTTDGGPAVLRREHSTTTATYASYVPHDLKYSPEFEDSLIEALLNPNPGGASNGIRVVLDDSDEAPVEGTSIRLSDISPQSLPIIAEHELPLPLSDPRRKFASPIPGILLTHPHGYIEGGPALDPSLDTFADDFLSNHSSITTPDQLHSAVQKEVEAAIESLKERLRKRKEGREKNEQIQRELKVLTDQHSMELRIQERMQEDARRKKEAREERRRRRQGG